MLKDGLLKLAFKSEEVTIGKEKCIVKEMNGRDSDEYESSLYSFDSNGKIKYNSKNAKAKLICSCLFDSEGNKVFEKNDIELIQQLPSSTISEIFSIATKLNKLNKEEAKKN